MASTTQLVLLNWGPAARTLRAFPFSPNEDGKSYATISEGVVVPTAGFPRFGEQIYAIYHLDAAYDTINKKIAVTAGAERRQGSTFCQIFGTIGPNFSFESAQEFNMDDYSNRGNAWITGPFFVGDTSASTVPFEFRMFGGQPAVIENASVAMGGNILFTSCAFDDPSSIRIRKRGKDNQNNASWSVTALKPSDGKSFYVDDSAIIFSRLFFPKPADEFKRGFCLSVSEKVREIFIDSISYTNLDNLGTDDSIIWERSFFTAGDINVASQDYHDRPRVIAPALISASKENKLSGYRLYLFWISRSDSDSNIYYSWINLRTDGSFHPPSGTGKTFLSGTRQYNNTVYTLEAAGISAQPDLRGALYAKVFNSRLWLFWSQRGNGVSCSAVPQDDGSLADWNLCDPNDTGNILKGLAIDNQWIPVEVPTKFADFSTDSS